MHSTILLTIVVSTSIQGELGILKEIIKQITIQLSIKIEMAYNKANPRKRRRRNNKLINAQQIVEKMKNQKINYDTVLKKMIMQWEKEEVKPKILIHTCCLLAVRTHWNSCLNMQRSRYFFKFEYSS